MRINRCPGITQRVSYPIYKDTGELTKSGRQSAEYMEALRLPAKFLPNDDNDKENKNGDNGICYCALLIHPVIQSSVR